MFGRSQLLNKSLRAAAGSDADHVSIVASVVESGVADRMYGEGIVESGEETVRCEKALCEELAVVKSSAKVAKGHLPRHLPRLPRLLALPISQNTDSK